MNDEGARFDPGFDDTGPFGVSPGSGGVSLESALRDFGPAAIDDLIPRLRAVAARLDAAHSAGIVHGALHPSKLIVTDTATSVIAGQRAIVPYAAPESTDGQPATPASDQYALAAIAHEWLFGRPIGGPADRPVDVRAMPGVDRAALSKAFTRALSRNPDQRFASCAAFVDALSAAVVPELPLLADVDDFASEDDMAPAAAAAAPQMDEALLAPDTPFEPESPDDLRIQPFDPERDNAFLEQDRPFDSDRDDVFLPTETPARNVDDVKIAAEESFLTAGQPDLDTIEPQVTERGGDPVAWNAAAAAPYQSRAMEPPRFGAAALFLAVIVGAVFGFAAGYMARPRALQTGQSQTFATDPQPPDAPKQDAAREQAPAASAPKTPQAPKAPIEVGSLLVRSTPSGATVSVDGAERGVTPLALRDLPFGSRNVVVTRRGFTPETRTVAISRERSSRTLDVRLTAERAAAPVNPKPRVPQPSTPATLGRPAAAASVGTLLVDSRPSGAAVTVNGKPSGTTPVTINDLPPGEYRVVLQLKGYLEFSTTARVVAGQSVRAAASLTAQEQE